MSDIVKKLLNVNSAKTMLFGATLIDTDPRAGYDMKVMAVPKHEFNFNPINTLAVYPEVEEILKDDWAAGNHTLALSCTYINGFVPCQCGYPDPEGMSKKSQNYFVGKSLVTTDQSFRSRPDGIINTLMAYYRWFGSSGDDGRLLDKSFIQEAESTKLTRKGLVCDHWLNNPVSVRWLVRVNKNEASDSDYVYMVGGSSDVISQSPAEFAKYITGLYDSILSLKEEARKSKTSSKNTNPSAESTPKFVWYAASSADMESKDPVIAANMLTKKLLRAIMGIFYIRNFFVYSKNINKISHVIEISYDSKKNEPIFTKIEIEKIIDKFDTIYAYCKNLCYTYKDIGDGSIMS